MELELCACHGRVAHIADRSGTRRRELLGLAEQGAHLQRSMSLLSGTSISAPLSVTMASLAVMAASFWAWVAGGNLACGPARRRDRAPSAPRRTVRASSPYPRIPCVGQQPRRASASSLASREPAPRWNRLAGRARRDPRRGPGLTGARSTSGWSAPTNLLQLRRLRRKRHSNVAAATVGKDSQVQDNALRCPLNSAVVRCTIASSAREPAPGRAPPSAGFSASCARLGGSPTTLSGRNPAKPRWRPAAQRQRPPTSPATLRRRSPPMGSTSPAALGGRPKAKTSIDS